MEKLDCKNKQLSFAAIPLCLLTFFYAIRLQKFSYTMNCKSKELFNTSKKIHQLGRLLTRKKFHDFVI